MWHALLLLQAKELSIQKCFSEAELEALHYLHLLEGFYSSQSYEEAQSWHARQHPRKMVFQATALPVMPRIISRPTPIPTLGNLHETYPETFGGVGAVCGWFNLVGCWLGCPTVVSTASKDHGLRRVNEISFHTHSYSLEGAICEVETLCHSAVFEKRLSVYF